MSSDNGDGGDNYLFTTFRDDAATSITAGSPPFGGSFRPEQPLSTLYPGTINGTWTLHVSDDFVTDTGSILEWLIGAGYPNGAATGVGVSPVVAAVNEGTLAAATKVADIAVADGDGGFQNFTLLGDDAGYFQIIGSGLFLIAGAVLDFESKPTLFCPGRGRRSNGRRCPTR